MTYTLPKHIDSNKIFLVNKKDIEQRLDSYFYSTEFILNINRIINKDYACLHNLVEFSSEYWNQKDYYSKTFPYIEISGIDIDNGEICNVSNVDVKDAPSRAKVIVRTDDIIISTTRPHRGAIAMVDKQINLSIASTGFSVIRNVSSKIYRQYLYIVLRLPFILKQLQQRSTGGNYPAITQEELGNILVPLPPKDKQQQIIDLYNTAYNQKKAKEQQAKELLASIDEYLLNELGITLPNIDNSLPSRVFIVNSKEISNSRFDPKGVLFLGDKMKSCIYDNIQLKDIAFIQKGTAITSNEIDSNGIYPVIAGGQTSPYKHSEYNYKGNIITISASGAYAGYVWYHKNPIFASDCSVIYSKDENSFCTNYIFEVLKAQQNHIYLLQIGAGQPHVYPDDLAKLWIPIVTLEKQKEIADHITEIRQKAKQLQDEAKQLLQQTKTEIEQMILE
ncbi:MAG: restriction endonuclease subunit S [Bacteroidales bacterium]|nr:restriction endonuclease subunit S [Bacteroidales bacterium]